MYTDMAIWPQDQKISTCMFCLWYRGRHELLKLHAHHKAEGVTGVSRNARLLRGLSDNCDHICSTRQNEYKTAILIWGHFTLTLHCSKCLLNFQENRNHVLWSNDMEQKRDWRQKNLDKRVNL